MVGPKIFYLVIHTNEIIVVWPHDTTIRMVRFKFDSLGNLDDLVGLYFGGLM